MGVVGNEPNPKSRKKEASYLRLGRREEKAFQKLSVVLSLLLLENLHELHTGALESLQGIPIEFPDNGVWQRVSRSSISPWASKKARQKCVHAA